MVGILVNHIAPILIRAAGVIHWNRARIVTILDKKTRLLDAIQYIILKTDQNGEVISVQPYDSTYLPETK